jgi:hypothetical protein
MIRAMWDRDRAYCGQPGCRNRAALGKVGGRHTPPGSIAVSAHWMFDAAYVARDADAPARCRHGRRKPDRREAPQERRAAAAAAHRRRLRRSDPDLAAVADEGARGAHEIREGGDGIA